MNLWQDDDEDDAGLPASRSLELGFRIDCRELPVDHAEVLSKAVLAAAPWLAEDAYAAVHPVHVAGSQNGWERPDRSTGELLIPSRRTRLRIRVDRTRADALAAALTGQVLEIDGYPLHIAAPTPREPLPSATLFARHIAYADADESEDEARFIERVVADCRMLGFSPRKLLCGRRVALRADGRDVLTRSVLLADVPDSASLPLQDSALGSWRLQGFGILIPHKDTGAVRR